jgi:hypothetical protein
MSQQRKLEKVLDLLLSEDSDKAAELLHQIIVEKARTIYEEIVDAEVSVDDNDDADALDEDDDIGGEPNKDFTDEIGTDKDEIDTDHQNDGEPDDDEEGDDGDGDEEGDFDGEPEDIEDRVDDLETQLADLRADFDEIMHGEEMGEPEDAGTDVDADFAMGSEMEGPEDAAMEDDSYMYEKKKSTKLEKAPRTKVAAPKGKKEVEEETQFLSKVADTGQRGTAKLVGAGTHSKLGAEQTKSSFTNIPARKDYGGKPVDFGKGTGGEYGKYHGDTAKDDTPSDNVKVTPSKSSIKADTTAKYTGGKPAGDAGSKSPLSKKPA